MRYPECSCRYRCQENLEVTMLSVKSPDVVIIRGGKTALREV